MVLILLKCIWLYKGACSAKTTAVANSRQVHKLYRHNQPTAFELQRPMSFCVHGWGCDTCMLLTGRFCSFLMGWLYTPCNIMVLLRLGTHVVAWTGRVMQCTVTACTLLWLVATRSTAHNFGGSMLFNLGRGLRRLTECSWADNCTLCWQLGSQVAAELTAELTSCSWADTNRV